MDLVQKIKSNTDKIRTNHAKSTTAYKKRLRQQLVDNLAKGQTPEDNQVIIDRFYAAKPKQLTTMQQAMLDATK